MKKTKRRRFWIDKEAQGAVVWRFLLHWASLAIALFTFCLFLQVLTNPFRTPGEHVRELIRDQGKTFALLLVLTPAFIWDAIKMTHRFAGPVSRLRTAMELLAAGQPTPEVKFRGGDCWQELAVYFNQIRERCMDAERNSKQERSAFDGESTVPIKIQPLRDGVLVGSENEELASSG